LPLPQGEGGSVARFGCFFSYRRAASRFSFER
jgi:hypothetical protein